MFTISTEQNALTQAQLDELHQMWRRCVRRILTVTTLAGSGHPGGSMSSLHLLLMLYGMLRHDPKDPCRADRDRLLLSMGHISPGAYAVLAEYGYIDEDAVCSEFRRAGSPFTGHVECCVPGVEWNTGNLGQGLSAGTGMALGLKLKKNPASVCVLMGDGEQQKGQISEARRFAVKYELNNLFGVVDRNKLQIGGDTDKVMPQSVRADYTAARWNVVALPDGHDFQAIFGALRSILLHEVDDPRLPSVLIARTVMGKGISFMENKAKYHGSTLNDAQAAEAFAELGIENPIPALREKRKATTCFTQAYSYPKVFPEIAVGEPRTYGADVKTDNRSAYGAVLEDLARLNNAGDVPKVLGFSCDLEGSVKMEAFHKLSPGAFFETGIQEHHAATVAGAVSKEGFATFLSTFGVFGICEPYNQNRLNDINHTHLKLVCTHLGLDVGEDGQTHQCIDYLALVRNLFGFGLFMPADPNQTDRIVRHIAAEPGNFFVGMGRSKMSMVLGEDGKPFFGGDYRFVPGRADRVRTGSDGAILSYGAILSQAVAAADVLKEKHGLRFTVLNMASLKPFDVDAVAEAAKTGLIVTAEDHHLDTGLGALTALALADRGIACKLVRLGVKRYGFSGDPAELYRLEEIDAGGIVANALKARQAR